MTSVTIEHFAVPSSSRAGRELAWLRAWAADELAGRTVWCAAAPDGQGQAAAHELQDSLLQAGDAAAADGLDVTAAEPLRAAAVRVEALLEGAAASGVDPADQAAFLEGALDCEELAGTRIGPDDVVVVHDALSALLAQAVRARGAHVVWHEQPATAPPQASTRQARTLLRRCAGGFDAYLVTWQMGHVAAAMPSASHVEAKEVLPGPGARGSRSLAWTVALADVVATDREEHVGGTLRSRPAVAAR
ncbi:MAG: hypothetical protein QOH43_3417 [Solirubrobacteraceae bacterium]|nr:hypothetical protein [Solirubrobacteraceae bacterium]